MEATITITIALGTGQRYGKGWVLSEGYEKVTLGGGGKKRLAAIRWHDWFVSGEMVGRKAGPIL